MILADTNIIGTLSRVASIDRLLTLFAKDELGVVAAVYAELVAGVREGREFLRAAVDLVDSGAIKLIALTPDEVVQRLNLPPSLDAGEAESIAVCRTRGAAFVSNDRRARNFCISETIEVFDLIDILRAFWKLGVCSKREVQRLVADIEAKEGMVIKNKERIFVK